MAKGNVMFSMAHFAGSIDEFLQCDFNTLTKKLMYRRLNRETLMPEPVDDDFRDPNEYRYNYDPHLIYHSGEKANDNVYNDRMMQWDWDKFHDNCEKIWGNRGQMFYSYERKPEDIEKFLRLYFDNPKLELCFIEENCNPSNGYSVWNFGLFDPTKEGNSEK